MEPIIAAKEDDRVTSSSDVVCPDRSPTKFEPQIQKTSSSPVAVAPPSSSANLCGKKLSNGKRCLTENVGGCANTGCSKHYGWQDEIEGFRLRTF